MCFHVIKFPTRFHKKQIQDFQNEFVISSDVVSQDLFLFHARRLKLLPSYYEGGNIHEHYQDA